MLISRVKKSTWQSAYSPSAVRFRSFVFCGKGHFFPAKMFRVIFLVSVALVARGEELVPDEGQEGKFFNLKYLICFSLQLQTLIHTECATNSRRALQVFKPIEITRNTALLWYKQMPYPAKYTFTPSHQRSNSVLQRSIIRWQHPVCLS